jgi:hypothetical protein
MKRTILLLALGALAGYSIGFKDARTHDRPVYERALDNVGGAARGKYGGDADRTSAGVDR